MIRPAVRALARSRTVARLVFGIDFPPLVGGERYFDLTTPAIVRLLSSRATPRDRVLDMGTGLFATIGLTLWRRLGCAVVSSDVDPAIVERAREAVRLNRAPVTVVQSRFLDGVDGPFDWVTFNPPYVPTHLVDKTEPFPGQSDGGPRGLDVFEGFLRSFDARGAAATALVGMNGRLVPQTLVREMLRAWPQLRLVDVLHVAPLPAEVYVLRRTTA